MKFKFENLPFEAVKGLLLSLLYFTITKANDTTFRNVALFITFYIIFVTSAMVVNINPDIVTSAFFTKTIFTLIDERVKKNKDQFSLF